MLVQSLYTRVARSRAPSCAPSATAEAGRSAARRRAARRKHVNRRSATTFRRWSAVSVARSPRSPQAQWLEVGAIYGLAALALTLGALGVIGLAQ